jgi:phage tail sheath gpL-like
MASGATNPTLTTALTNLTSQSFDFIASPYTDATSMAALTAFLNDTTGRWSYTNQIYGHCFIASRGTLGTLQTLGGTLNDQHTSLLGFNDSPSPSWVWAAALTGAAAGSLKVDPGMPLQTVPIYGVLAPPVASQFAISGRNSLLYTGVSTFTVDQAGIVHCENIITTYQKNGFGIADNSYLEVETMYLLMYVLRALATVVTSKYSRMKLAANGTRFAPGSGIVTPNIIKGDLIATYQQLEFDGFVQNAAAFAKGLIVTQNATNPNRVDVLYPAVLIDQLRVFAVLLQFRLI